MTINRYYRGYLPRSQEDKVLGMRLSREYARVGDHVRCLVIRAYTIYQDVLAGMGYVVVSARYDQVQSPYNRLSSAKSLLVDVSDKTVIEIKEASSYPFYECRSSRI